MAINQAVQPNHDLGIAVALFRGLAEPTRLAILQRLAAGEARVVDLTRTLDLAQSTVSGHLACLRDCGLTGGRCSTPWPNPNCSTCSLPPNASSTPPASKSVSAPTTARTKAERP
jgi:hypothetical protein